MGDVQIRSFVVTGWLCWEAKNGYKQPHPGRINRITKNKVFVLRSIMTAGSVVNMPLKNCLEKDKCELGFGQNVGEDLLRDHCAPFWTEAWSHPSFCWLNYLKIKTFTAEFQNHISKLEQILPFFSCLCHISTSLLSILQISTLISHLQPFYSKCAGSTPDRRPQIRPHVPFWLLNTCSRYILETIWSLCLFLSH